MLFRILVMSRIVVYLRKVSSMFQFLLVPTVIKKGIETTRHEMKIAGKNGRSITAAVTPGILELSVTRQFIYN